MALLGTPLERAFFVDMLSNGIPIKKNTDVEQLFSNVSDIALESLDADVIFEGEELSVVGKYGNKITKAVVENTGKGRSLIFYTVDNETALENASIVGQLLFILVTQCVMNNWLDIEDPVSQKPKPAVSAKKEDNFEFDSEFI